MRPASSSGLCSVCRGSMRQKEKFKDCLCKDDLVSAKRKANTSSEPKVLSLQEDWSKSTASRDDANDGM